MRNAAPLRRGAQGGRPNMSEIWHGSFPPVKKARPRTRNRAFRFTCQFSGPSLTSTAHPHTMEAPAVVGPNPLTGPVAAAVGIGSGTVIGRARAVTVIRPAGDG